MLHRHSTSLVYEARSGRIVLTSHIETVEGSIPPADVLAEVERNAIDDACRMTGIVRDSLAVLSVDPKDFDPNSLYSVNPVTGKLERKPIRGIGGSAPKK